MVKIKQQNEASIYFYYNFVQMTNLSQNVKSFISGWVTGCSQVLVMQPFEIIKVRQINEVGTSLKYSGFIKSFRTILLEEGPLSFYKGTFSPLLGYGLQNSLQFGFNRFFRRILASLNGGVETTDTLFLAGILTGVPSAIAITPADHMRILMQKQYHGQTERYTGQFSAAKDILARHGPKGLYLGFSTTLLRQFFAMAIYFTTFEQIKKLMDHDSKGGIVEKMKIMFAGAIAGLASWVFPYPIDFVKTKMQSQDLDKRTYKNSWDCFTINYKEHGWRGFTRGLWTVCLRSIPVNSMAFLIEEETAILLGRQHVNEW